MPAKETLKKVPWKTIGRILGGIVGGGATTFAGDITYKYYGDSQKCRQHLRTFRERP